MVSRVLDFVRGRIRKSIGLRPIGLRRKPPNVGYNIDIFLSHAGEDHQEVQALAGWLRNEFSRRGRALRVFNTSEPESRFPQNVALENGTYEKSLQQFLANNMEKSLAYLLVISPRSLKKRANGFALK